MELEEEVMKNGANTKMNELKIEAIISILSREGILTHEEVQAEVENIIKEEDKEISDDA